MVCVWVSPSTSPRVVWESYQEIDHTDSNLPVKIRPGVAGLCLKKSKILPSGTMSEDLPVTPSKAGPESGLGRPKPLRGGKALNSSLLVTGTRRDSRPESPAADWEVSQETQGGTDQALYKEETPEVSCCLHGSSEGRFTDEGSGQPVTKNET